MISRKLFWFGGKRKATLEEYLNDNICDHHLLIKRVGLIEIKSQVGGKPVFFIVKGNELKPI